MIHLIDVLSKDTKRGLAVVTERSPHCDAASIPSALLQNVSIPTPFVPSTPDSWSPIGMRHASPTLVPGKDSSPLSSYEAEMVPCPLQASVAVPLSRQWTRERGAWESGLQPRDGASQTVLRLEPVPRRLPLWHSQFGRNHADVVAGRSSLALLLLPLVFGCHDLCLHQHPLPSYLHR